MPPGVQMITENVYTHRKPRQIDEDDVLTCSCRHSRRVRKGKDGSKVELPICCDETCENYSVRTECLIGFCSKARCQNQRLQRKQFNPVALVDCGMKGLGLVVSINWLRARVALLTVLGGRIFACCSQ